MRVVAYSIKNYEKEFLAKANHKKHDITLISNHLSLETALYAKGKDAVLVFPKDDVSAAVINKLSDLGVKYISSRSEDTDFIDHDTAAQKNIQVAKVNVKNLDSVSAAQEIASQTILNLDLWQQSKVAEISQTNPEAV